VDGVLPDIGGLWDVFTDLCGSLSTLDAVTWQKMNGPAKLYYVGRGIWIMVFLSSYLYFNVTDMVFKGIWRA